MGLSAKLTLLICITASFLSNCSFGENIAPRKLTQPQITSREKTLFDVDQIELPYSFEDDTLTFADALYNAGLKMNRGRAQTFASQEAIRLNPRHAKAYVQLGLHRQDSANNVWEVGIPFLQKAIAIDPSLFIAYRHLINALVALNRHDEATTFYHQIIRQSPKTAEDFLAMAAIHQRLNLNEAAIEAYEKALQKARRNLEIEKSVNKTYPRLGGCCEAEIELNAISKEAMSTLASLYSKAGNKEKAQEYERKLKQLSQ